MAGPEPSPEAIAQLRRPFRRRDANRLEADGAGADHHGILQRLAGQGLALPSTPAVPSARSSMGTPGNGRTFRVRPFRAVLSSFHGPPPNAIRGGHMGGLGPVRIGRIAAWPPGSGV
jgi:hypothetical protein